MYLLSLKDYSHPLPDEWKPWVMGDLGDLLLSACCNKSKPSNYHHNFKYRNVGLLHLQSGLLGQDHLPANMHQIEARKRWVCEIK